jgi:uncharacterized membrane protein YeaQ/YmgE (transglycosylase-associated protein family)
MSLHRLRQIIVGLIGAFYVCLLYPLFSDLHNSRWLIEMHNEECEPMFISFFVVLGVFLLIAARRPDQHRIVIAFAAWQSLFHCAVMAVMTIEAARNGTPRQIADVIITAVIGVVLIALTPRRVIAPSHP